jgi:matrixin
MTTGISDTSATTRNVRAGRTAMAVLLTVGIAAGGAGLTSAPAEASGATYVLSMQTLPDGHRVAARWDPCQKAITVRINPRLASTTEAGREAAVTDVRRAVRLLSEKTGIPFVLEGLTTQVPKNTRWAWWRLQSSAEIVVAWVHHTGSYASNLLSSGAAGSGGYSYKAWKSGSTWRGATGRGYVVLDASQRGSFRGGFTNGVTRGALLLHELGHVMGLQHVGTTSQLMYPTILNRAHSYYFSGDRAGLAKVGRPAGCLNVPAQVWSQV